MSDFTVKIEYKNEKMETVVEKEFEFCQYTDMLYTQLMGVLKEVEDAFYEFSDGKRKEDWSPNMQARFKVLRNKILDEANSIKRLPHTLTYKGISPDTLNAGAFIADVINHLNKP